MAHRLGCLSGEAARRFFYFAQSADVCCWHDSASRDVRYLVVTGAKADIDQAALSKLDL